MKIGPMSATSGSASLSKELQEQLTELSKSVRVPVVINFGGMDNQNTQRFGGMDNPSAQDCELSAFEKSLLDGNSDDGESGDDFTEENFNGKDEDAPPRKRKRGRGSRNRRCRKNRSTISRSSSSSSTSEDSDYSCDSQGASSRSNSEADDLHHRQMVKKEAREESLRKSYEAASPLPRIPKRIEFAASTGVAPEIVSIEKKKLRARVVDKTQCQKLTAALVKEKKTFKGERNHNSKTRKPVKRSETMRYALPGSLSTSLSQIDERQDIPVGGRLAYFARNWSVLGIDKWAASVLAGYKIPFHSKCPPLAQREVNQGSSHPLLLGEIKKMLEKGAIEEIPWSEKVWLSSMFCIPKKDGSVRPIINLKPLNKFVALEHFKMESLTLLKDLVETG
ncbi:unnamed protein product [Heligmosomoides polygyrus]|uniref:PHD-type domain-containing protein n=1 Tax=Heligmosomoides polygyrus TaxID=6339 RepID=A0A183GRQ3_HELPZ|nr:unnamed protein product [Heligmosomoides polygyrus]